MSGPRGYYTKRNKTGRKTNAIGFDSCGIKKNNRTKTHRYGKQSHDCQRGWGVKGRQNRGRGMKGTNFQVQNNMICGYHVQHREYN